MTKEKQKAIDSRQWDKDLSDRTMQARLEHFHELWMPEDREMASRFASDLHMLVRSIYAEAAEPANKQLLAFVRAMPSQPLIIKSENPQ